MSDLKPKPIGLELGGKEYGLLFNLNAIEEIQDKFDIPISKLTDLMRDERQVFKVLKSLLAILINEAIDDAENGDPHIDERFVGRKITVAEIPKLKEKIFAAFTDGMPEGEDDDANPPKE